MTGQTKANNEVSQAAPVETALYGYDLLLHPALNKGTAFTDDERDRFALHGLLPPHVGTLEDQCERRSKAFDSQDTPFAQYSFMRDLQDSNETLFYSLIGSNVEKFLPVVYTPGVGEGCQRFSEIWRKARGLFVSYPNKERMDQMFADTRYDGVRCIVVSDGERILGLGDQGAGGMGIPIGKMALYTALAGVPPQDCLPILLDVGTDNEDRLKDPAYIGWKHTRVRGQDYDDFVEAFVSAVKRRWPHILLQWEDFAGTNASRLLERYRHQLCTFNDDIQGTAAVTTATILAAVTATGTPLSRQRIGIFGFGTAGIGIANLLVQAMREAGLSDQQAHERFYGIDRSGLIIDDQKNLSPDHKAFARLQAEVESWKLPNGTSVGLLDVVRNAGLTILIGVSGQAGAFTEDVVREMAKHVARPVIFPLSNPTSRSEAAPRDLLAWTDGNALIGTGSPYPPVEHSGRTIHFAQTNNSYIFPGLALGILASRAKQVSDAMIMAAAKALASLSPTEKDKDAPLLPPLSTSRDISLVVAEAVGQQAIAESLSDVASDALEQEVRSYVWNPVYRRYARMAANQQKRSEG